MTNVEKFYDEFGGRYTESVRRCNPCYDEMLASGLAYLPASWSPVAILELGCGTGNLTLLLQAHYPQARLTALDISAEALAECRARIPSPLVHLTKGDMSEWACPNASFSLVISSLAVHHLFDEQKRALFARVHRWLVPGGYFVLCDRCLEDGDYLRETNRRIREEKAFARGATTEEWQKWTRHEAEHDHPGTLLDQLTWLKEAGFASADCVWRKWTWATIHARKDLGHDPGDPSSGTNCGYRRTDPA